MPFPEELSFQQQIYQGRAVNFHVDTVRKPDGGTTPREVVEHSECVVAVAINDQGQVILVRQFRYPVKKFLLEVPAGGIDPGEKPLDALHRELQEEIGYLPRRVTKMGGFYSIPGYGNEYLHCYLATDLVPSRLVAEDTEGIEIVLLDREQTIQHIASGEICDAKSIAALLTYFFVNFSPHNL